MQGRARYCRITPCALQTQPLSYALKTWKGRKEQFTTRNKTLTLMPAHRGQRCAQKVLYSSPGARMCVKVPPSGRPPPPLSFAQSSLGMLPSISPAPFLFFFLLMTVIICFSLERAVEVLVFQILLDKGKLPLPDQPQSETLMEQMYLPLCNTAHSKRLTVNVPHMPANCVTLACRRQGPRGVCGRVPRWSRTAGQGRCHKRL